MYISGANWVLFLLEKRKLVQPFLPWDAVKIVYMVYNNSEIHKTQYNEISSKGNGPCFLFWSVLPLLVAIFSTSGFVI